MAINTELLIAAPMLQDYFVDKTTGTPLAAGIVTCYQDNSRTTLKNWYYQTGSPGSYTYTQLPNPLTLSAVGTISDANGVDTIPFFYPYDENDDSTVQTYYITVDSSTGTRQFTRQNFPFVSQEAVNNNVPTLDNVITNNVFYHNIGSLNLTNVTNTVLAPSQHDGYMASNLNDIRFVKSVNGATDTVTFTSFGLNNDPLVDDITPEYYLNLQCSATQAGETRKSVLIPISFHIKTLESVNATVTIQGQNVAGSTSSTITLNIYQFTGTGALSPSVTTVVDTIQLTNSWQKYSKNFTFPSSQGLTLSSAGDDAFFLEIGYPLSSTFDINIAKPSIYLSDEVPTNDFDTYDEIDTVINSPRTGDIRTSLNSFQPFGWILMNDGTVGNASSGATRANIDTWNLFSLLWNSVGATYAPLFTSAGAPVAYGADAITDWNANRRISVTKQLGRAIASLGISSSGGSTTWVLGQTAGEQLHTQSVAEMPAHSHTGSFIRGGDGGGGTDQEVRTGSLPGTLNVNVTMTSNGGGDPFNITQPTTFYNMFMKL
jgi:hypothetical protein